MSRGVVAIGVLHRRRPRDDGPIIAAIWDFVEINPTQDFNKLYPALRTEGFGKCRLYRALRLNLTRRGKRPCQRG